MIFLRPVRLSNKLAIGARSSPRLAHVVIEVVTVVAFTAMVVLCSLRLLQELAILADATPRLANDQDLRPYFTTGDIVFSVVHLQIVGNAARAAIAPTTLCCTCSICLPIGIYNSRCTERMLAHDICLYVC